MDVVGGSVETGVEAYVEAVGGGEPFRQAAACVFREPGGDLHTLFADGSSSSGGEAERITLRFLIPTCADFTRFEVVAKDHRGMARDIRVGLVFGGETAAARKRAGGREIREAIRGNCCGGEDEQKRCSHGGLRLHLFPGISSVKVCEAPGRPAS